MELFSGKTQQTAKKYFTSKRKSLKQWQAQKGEPHEGTCLKNLIFFH
jgi:hypothetical protein